MRRCVDETTPSHPNPNPHVHMLLCDRNKEGKVDGMFHPNPADSPHLEMTRSHDSHDSHDDTLYN